MFYGPPKKRNPIARVIRNLGHKLIPDKRLKQLTKEIAREISKERQGGKASEE